MYTYLLPPVLLADGFFYFLVVLLAGNTPGGYFANVGPAMVVNIHIWFTTSYNAAKLDNMIPDKWLAPRDKWWFPDFEDVQPFDIAAYKKWDIANVFEMMVYAIVIGVMCATNLSKATGLEKTAMLAGMGAGFAGTGFCLFLICMFATCVDRFKPMAMVDKAKGLLGDTTEGYQAPTLDA